MQIITRHRQEKSTKRLQTHHHDHCYDQHNPHRSDEQSKTILIIIRMASIIIIILSKFISNGRRRRQPLAADGSVSSKWTLTASLLFTHHHYNTHELFRIIVSSFTKARLRCQRGKKKIALHTRIVNFNLQNQPIRNRKKVLTAPFPEQNLA